MFCTLGRYFRSTLQCAVEQLEEALAARFSVPGFPVQVDHTFNISKLDELVPSEKDKTPTSPSACRHDHCIVMPNTYSIGLHDIRRSRMPCACQKALTNAVLHLSSLFLCSVPLSLLLLWGSLNCCSADDDAFHVLSLKCAHGDIGRIICCLSSAVMPIHIFRCFPCIFGMLPYLPNLWFMAAI